MVLSMDDMLLWESKLFRFLFGVEKFMLLNKVI